MVHKDPREIAGGEQPAFASAPGQINFQNLLGNLPGIAFRCRHDPDWTMEFLSEGCTRYTGYAPSELLQNRAFSYEQIIHPNDREMVHEKIGAALATSDTYEVVYRIITAQGEEQHVCERATAIHDSEGNPCALEGFITDITERMNLETQLRHSQKMQAVGQLAGGIAHDFNNLLQVIIGFGECIREELPEDGVAQGRMAEVLKAANRAASLVSQLLAFSRRQVHRPTVLNINGLLDDMQAMIRTTLNQTITLSLVTNPAVHFVKADKAQIEQVVLNICLNARDAMPGGGRLELKVFPLALGETYCKLHQWARPGVFTALSITDTGVGMPPRVLSQIFEPFFTTKEVGKGTGLGLAVTYGIISKHDGLIRVQSEEGKGTTVTICLPAVDAGGSLVGMENG